MIALLVDNPVLTLFVVAGAGFLVGKLKIGGFSLGVSAVLFTGLAAGSLDARIALPEIIYQLGLVIFVYSVAVASGPGFMSALRRRGLRNNALVLSMLLLAFAVVIVIYLVTDISSGQAAGLFAGSLTNTPALAAVVEHLRGTGAAAVDPVVAYSLAYPFGVVGTLLAIYLLQRLWRVDYTKESAAVAPESHEPIVSWTVAVDRDQVGSIGELLEETAAHVVFSRVRHRGELGLAGPETRLERGDLVNVIGAEKDVGGVVDRLGHRSEEYLPFDRQDIDARRMFVSKTAVAGRTIRELELPHRFGAVITRVRRGDVDVLARDDMVLEPGDRVRVVGSHEALGRVASYLGDSFRALSELDVLTFSIGVALGLLLGSVSVPLPGEASLKPGLAAGPLIVGLVLGARERTGPLVWQLPYNVSITLRQFGVVLFLAGIGTRAGDAFADTLTAGGLDIVLAGAAVTTVTALGTLIIGYKLLHAPMGVLGGVLAGLQTQPAVLAYATEQAGEELPNIGYATVFPLAMIVKIVLAQILVLILR